MSSILFLVFLQSYRLLSTCYSLIHFNSIHFPSQSHTLFSNPSSTYPPPLIQHPYSFEPEFIDSLTLLDIAFSNPAPPNASTPHTAKPISTRANPSASTAACQSSSRSMSRSARRCRARRRAARAAVGVACLECKITDWESCWWDMKNWGERAGILDLK